MLSSSVSLERFELTKWQQSKDEKTENKRHHYPRFDTGVFDAINALVFL
jgi:hypothetical protein